MLTWKFMALYASIKKYLKNKDLSTCVKKPEKEAQNRTKKGRKKQFNQKQKWIIHKRFNSIYERTDKRISKPEDQLRSFNLRNKKKNNEEKWTESKRPRWYYQAYQPTHNESPRRQKGTKEQRPKASKPWLTEGWEGRREGEKETTHSRVSTNSWQDKLRNSHTKNIIIKLPKAKHKENPENRERSNSLH